MRTLGYGLLLLAISSFMLCALVAALLDVDESRRKPIEAARADLLKVANGLDGEDPTKREPLSTLRVRAERIARLHQLEDVDVVFKLTRRGGVGIGALTKAGHLDSIEFLLNDYATKGTTKDEVVKYADDLQCVGRLTLL